jgi:hypothetical protein
MRRMRRQFFIKDRSRRKKARSPTAGGPKCFGQFECRMPHEFAHGARGKVRIAGGYCLDDQYVITRRHERLDQRFGNAQVYICDLA